MNKYWSSREPSSLYVHVFAFVAVFISVLGTLFDMFLQGKYSEAQPLVERALAITERALGVDHVDTITSYACLAGLYVSQGFVDKAFPLLEEVVSARERVQGRDHPDVAAALNDWASLLATEVGSIIIFLESSS